MEITVVVGSATVVAENEAHHVKALAVPSSVICIIIMSPATGVPERFVVNDVIACAKPVIVNMSPLSVFIVGVADCVVDTTRLVIRLFVRVDVELMVGTVTPSTAITPADTLDMVVSVACPSSMLHVVVEFVVPFEIVPEKVVFQFFNTVIASLLAPVHVPFQTTSSLSVEIGFDASHAHVVANIQRTVSP